MYAALLAWDEIYFGVSLGKWYVGLFAGYYSIQFGSGHHVFEVDVEEVKEALQDALNKNEIQREEDGKDS